MDIKLEKLDVLQHIMESDYLSMTDGLEKIFIKKVKKAKSYLADNEEKLAEEEIEEYKSGRLYNWSFFMRDEK